jgi:hypothetical protein
MDNHKLQQKVDEAMASIDGIQRAYPKPFFFTRLQARIDRRKQNPWERIAGTIARPAFAVLSVVAVIAINTVVIVNKNSSSKAIPEHAEMAIADEYSNSIAYYAIENAQP